jgi:hypothetical protein
LKRAEGFDLIAKNKTTRVYMIGVIYARYSSDNQREESIEGQLRECMAFAERSGINGS